LKKLNRDPAARTGITAWEKASARADAADIAMYEANVGLLPHLSTRYAALKYPGTCRSVMANENSRDETSDSPHLTSIEGSQKANP
jgi:hypothetical protein